MQYYFNQTDLMRLFLFNARTIRIYLQIFFFARQFFLAHFKIQIFITKYAFFARKLVYFLLGQQQKKKKK